LTTTTPVLQVSNLSKSFGGAKALNGVNLTVRPGQVHGLLGENGSGKSTLIKVLAGFHVPDEGEVQVNGKDVHLPILPGESQKLGFEFVHQNLGLVDSMSVTENLFMQEIARPDSGFYMSWAAAERRAREVFSRYSLKIDPSLAVEQIRPVERAMLAIARAMEGLSRHAPGVATLLVLDEPTVFLPAQEIRQLFGLVRQITSHGSSVLFVSHDLEEVKQIADAVTVLRDGRVAGETETSKTTTDQLIRLIIGHDLESVSPTDDRPEAKPALVEVRELSTPRVADVSFDVGVGEILGLTGLVGSGYDDVLYALFGALKVNSGRMRLSDSSIDLVTLTPQRAMRHAIALVPGDRQRLGSVSDLTVAENVNLLVLDRFSRGGRLRHRKLSSNALELLQEFDVRPRRADIPYESLSGGNQQKALMAKWLQIGPQLLLLDEPTQGVDVGARQQIWRAVRAASASASIICASSDHEQLAGLCDRVGVVARGRLVGFLSGADLTKERIADFCLRSAVENVVTGPGGQTAVGAVQAERKNEKGLPL